VVYATAPPSSWACACAWSPEEALIEEECMMRFVWARIPRVGALSARFSPASYGGDEASTDRSRSDESLRQCPAPLSAAVREGLSNDEARSGDARGAARLTVSREVPWKGRRASPRSALILTSLIAAFWYFAFIFRTSFVVAGERYFVLFEDAMISMRYARNLARGYGLVWNPNETPVEGYTNLLWTLWMSIPHLLGLPTSKTSLFVMLTGVAIMIAIGFVTAATARRLSLAPWVPWACATCVWFSYPLMFWTLRGMEVGAVALLITTMVNVAFAFEDRPSNTRALALGTMAAACLLVRADSAPTVLLLMAYVVWRSPPSMRPTVAAVVAGLPTAALGLHLRFRHGLYHEVLPNTAFLKLMHVPLFARLKRGAFTLLVDLGMQLAIPISTIVVVARSAILRAVRDRQRMVLLLALVVVQNAYSVFVGGDAWEWFRFANRHSSVVLPIFSLLLVASIARVADGWDDGTVAPPRSVVRRVGLAMLFWGLLLIALQVYAHRFGEEGMGAGILYSPKVVVVGAGLGGIGGTVAALVGAPAAVRLFELLRRASLRGPGAGPLLGAAVCSLFLLGQIDAMVFWVRNNAPYFDAEAAASRLGILIATTTPPELRVAVVAAGATPYFSDRPTEDMLGKSDAIIAKQTPKLAFFAPGHDKWDYVHSLRDRSPSLVVELPNDDETERYRGEIEDWGFERLQNGMWLKRATPRAPIRLISK
jgi:hypothetical protein